MKANIVLNYENTTEQLYLWANGENHINFRKDLFEAKRCTISFAATEIITYLGKIGIEASYSNNAQNGCFNIYIDALDESFEESEFTLTPVTDGIKILGKSRTGALYGAYEFLRLQGIRWLSLEQDVIPQKTDKIINIDKEKTFKASMTIGRGYTFEGALKDSTKLWLWMARNRMNFAASRPYSAKFQKKLGMSFDNGGHILEPILNPDNRTENGKTFWEEHRDWYGTDDKEEITKENALNIQFCMSNEELFDYIADELIDRINTLWYEADRLTISVFDTWGKTCMCEKCKKLGNGTDKQLNFLSGMRNRLNKAYEDGRIDHNVTLCIWAYEGTDSLEAPINPVPQNLVDAGDYALYWPIIRCYKHHIDDETCSYNEVYSKSLSKWSQMPMMMGEYYNVSKFEDIPLIFKNSMAHDIKKYYEWGINGMSYMHIPMVNWGMRNLTQSLYAQLQWDINTDVDDFIKQYYKDRYMNYAEQMEKVYDLVEEATLYCQSYRAWGGKSVLTQLMKWDGRKPDSLLWTDDHLCENAVSIGKKATQNYQEAYEIALNCWKDEVRNTIVPEEIKQAVNPMMLRELPESRTTLVLEEDVASLKYGTNMMKIITLFTEYHDAMFKGENTDELWKEIDALATDMMQSYFLSGYVNSETRIEMFINNTLKRSQLNALYYRCKALRNQ